MRYAAPHPTNSSAELILELLKEMTPTGMGLTLQWSRERRLWYVGFLMGGGGGGISAAPTLKEALQIALEELPDVPARIQRELSA